MTTALPEGVTQEEMDALAADQQADTSLIRTPILKVAQPLTKEVDQELVEPGEFFNTGTSESLGTRIEFIVAHFDKGRSARDKETGRYYVAGYDTIPDRWADLVGEEFVGTPFSEYPDAEEQFKTRVNRKEIKWGHGPLVSTTYNFTGFVLAEDPETGETEYQPVRLSLQRSTKDAAGKWHMLRASKLRNKNWWDKTFLLDTAKKQFDGGSSFIVNVKLGRDTGAEEKTEAARLAIDMRRGNVVDNAESEGTADAPAEPDAKGGAAI